MPLFSGSLDANILLRLLLNDIPSQHTAAAVLLQKSSGQFAVADTAVIEIAFVLERHYAFARSAISEAIEGVMSLTEVNCNRDLLEKVADLYKEPQSII